MQYDLHTITALVAAATMLTLLVGYGRALGTHNGAVFHLVVSICLVVIGYVTRTFYWNVLPPAALFEFKSFYGNEINVVFDTFAIWGGVHGHLAIYKMIPDEDRKHWRFFTAWLYPPFAAHRCVRVFIRRIMEWRS